MLQIQRNIELIRGVADLNQVEFARLIGATEAMIKSYEGGKASPKKIVIKNRICELAGITLDQLENKVLKEKDININVELVSKVNKVERNLALSDPAPEARVEPADLTGKYIALLEKRESEASLADIWEAVQVNQRILAALYENLVEESKKNKTLNGALGKAKRKGK